uniref:Uncharacterized protein n=1 Tax=Acrobeloides nanus TaxID=290746 RepID=A0A914CYJ0_9BILA
MLLAIYFDAFNREILQYQPVDQGVNYVFVLFTATTDTNDVQQAISLRQKYFDPYGYGVIILRIKAPTEPLPTTIPQIYTRETTQEATTIELESTTV